MAGPGEGRWRVRVDSYRRWTDVAVPLHEHGQQGLVTRRRAEVTGVVPEDEPEEEVGQ